MDRKLKVPLYYQITEDMREKIRILPPGAQIPTESSLMQCYGVSRGTIRQAIGDLVNEGLVAKVQGRGSFRASSKKERSAYFADKSFTQQILETGHTTGIENVSCVMATASVDVAAYLHIEKGTPVRKLTRLRTVDGLPYAYGTAYLRPELLPAFRKKDLELSLTELLTEKYRVDLGRKQTFCRAKLSDAKLAKLLSIEENLPTLQMDTIFYLANGEPLLVDIFQYTNTYVLHLEAPDDSET